MSANGNKRGNSNSVFYSLYSYYGTSTFVRSLGSGIVKLNHALRVWKVTVVVPF